MKSLLIRYWFQTNKSLGVGVTAYSLDDAIQLIQKEKIAMMMEPIFDSYIENIDIRELDQNHVIPNMGVCSNRGIWFPNAG